MTDIKIPGSGIGDRIAGVGFLAASERARRKEEEGGIGSRFTVVL